MRTRQVVFAVTAAIAGTIFTVVLGGYLPRYVLVAPIIYLISRWGFAAVGRIKYYLRKTGQSGHSCGGCGQYVSRRRSDWILTCYRCGWKEGLPLLRWATSSVPAKQIRRTVSLRGLLLISLCLLLILSPSIATPLPEATSDDYNRTEVRQEFQHLLNEERERRGLQTLDRRTELQKMGQSHAENMATFEYMGHVQPDGDNIEDRYRERGLLPECRLPLENSNRYYPGAENAYQGYVDAEIERDYAPDFYVGNSEDLAQVMFDSWMNSRPHRKAMLVSSADEMGLGFKTTEADKIYAALELC